MRRSLIAVAVASQMLAAFPAHATPSYRPDLASGDAGDGIYGRDAAQIADLDSSPGFGIAWLFEVQNDGSRTDTVRLRLRSKGDPDVVARIIVDDEDATALFSPGPYRVPHLAPQEAFEFWLGLSPTVDASPGDAATFRLVAISAGDATARDLWVFHVTAAD